MFTSFLFMLGKYGISVYLSQNMTASSYGAAGSIIILLAWVYYSSAILYFGAEFTKEYAIKYGKGITQCAVGLLSNKMQGFLFCLDIFLLADFVQVLNSVVDSDPFKIEYLATTENGGKNFMFFGGS